MWKRVPNFDHQMMITLVYVDCVWEILLKLTLPGVNIRKNHLHGLEHFRSNGIGPVFLQFDDLRISRKWRKIEQTLPLHLDMKSCICHRTLRTLRRLYSVPWPKFSRSNIWNNNILKRWELAHKCLLYAMIYAIEWNHCTYCTPWYWPTFQRSIIWNVNIAQAVRDCVKMRATTFTAVYIRCRMA